MGNKLQIPVKNEDSYFEYDFLDQDNKFFYQHSAIQGNTYNMEDSHIYHNKLNEKNYCIFGILDGHGSYIISNLVAKIFSKNF